MRLTAAPRHTSTARAHQRYRPLRSGCAWVNELARTYTYTPERERERASGRERERVREFVREKAFARTCIRHTSWLLR